MLVLVVMVGRNRGAAAIRHLDGFVTHASDLRSRLGIDTRVVEVPHIDLVQHEVRAWMPDVVIFAPSFVDSVDQVIAMCKRVRQNRPEPKLVYFDSYDLTSSPHFGVLPYVDRYLKSKLLTKTTDYQRKYQGGNPLADFVVRELKADLSGWYFGSEIPPGEEHKIRPCWSFGVSRDFEKLLKWSSRFHMPWGARIFDVNRRIALTQGDGSASHWYAKSRRNAADALAKLSTRHRYTGSGRVPRRLYLAELAFSKIVFSPFGWGEVCFRDYEAAAAGCLLVKPDMSHITTSPNIFVDNQTYISVKWDLSDLGEKVDYWLARPKESQAIAQCAHDTLSAYFANNKFVDDVASALDGLIPGVRHRTASTSTTNTGGAS